MSSDSSPSSGSSDSTSDTNSTLCAQMKLFDLDEGDEDREELAASPLFTETVLRYGNSLEKSPFTQYGLLGRVMENDRVSNINVDDAAKERNLMFNATAPSSVFICGSQGSGKSHTLSCLLENCLMQSEANVLPRPLTGIVFHYDPWISASRGSPCEAAYLASAEDISVRVLCPPTNVRDIEKVYSRLPNVQVETLRIDQTDLDTKRMMDLMAVSSVQGGGIPLYLHVVQRILRDLRIEQQASNTMFNYCKFKKRLMEEDLAVGQLVPLQQRLDTLESFMVKEQVANASGAFSKPTLSKGNNWEPKAGQLTIVDLSCPCVREETACSLFNICLSLFLEQNPEDIGRVVALDEAHKYMTGTAECEVLTNSLLSNIRLQRHLGLRVIISTQEPTISPKLLDLCSVTIVHRFTSPDWLQSLKKHLAGASISFLNKGQVDGDGDKNSLVAGLNPNDFAMELFSKIVALRRGQALLFCPSAIIDVRKTAVKAEGGLSTSNGWNDAEETVSEEANPQLIKLSHGHMKIRVRRRVTQDGGRSILAV
ncbi:hypothetical protein ACQKWADRAFT_67317 [Trichoderma austrokoningii]